MAVPRFWKWFSQAGAPRRPNTTRLTLATLDERIVPTVQAKPIFAVGSGPGMDATVKVYNAQGTLLSTFKPYPLPGGTFFQGGVEVAVGDVDSDGHPDVITGASAGGGPHVKVWSGADIMNGSNNPATIRNFFAFENGFTGGVNVACGDINGDGFGDVICGRGPGGVPQVIAFSSGNFSQQLVNFNAYESTFAGGVNVASGDVGGDQTTDEIITGAGTTGGPKVNIYDFNASASTPATAARRLASYFAYDSNLRCGVFVASGYTSNNRDASQFLYADVVTGAGQSGGPHVKVFRLLDAINDSAGNPNWQYFEAGNLFAYAANFTGGVRVGVVRNGNFDDILTGAGVNGGPHQKIFNQTSIPDLTTYVPTQRMQQFTFDPSFLGGIYVSD